MSEGIWSLLTDLSEAVRSDWGAQNSLLRSLILPVAFSGFGAFAGATLAYKFRRSLVRISVADLVHTNGFGWVLWSSR
jgi:hypothetical protein